MHVRVGDIVVIVISLVRSVPYLLCFVFERATGAWQSVDASLLSILFTSRTMGRGRIRHHRGV